MDDYEIIDLYWQRSDRAIEESNKKYGGYCHRIAYNICKNREDAEECVNDTWFGAWNQMPDKRPTVLSVFLGSMTRNFAINRVKAKSRKKRGGGQFTLALDELSECVPAPGDVEREFEAKELETALDTFVGGLPETERKVFVARYWFMAPVNEIAEKFGFSDSKTKSILYRTRSRLREYLREENLC